MNQIKKRLSIIHLAISITDIETIELQVLKLKLLKIDLRVEEIINLLQSRNYAQAQTLITKYIDTDDEKLIPKDRPKTKDNPTLSDEDQAIIDEFQLFVAPTKRIRASNKKEEPIDIDEFAPISTPKTEERRVPKELFEEESLQEVKDERPKVVNIDIDNLLKIEPDAKEEPKPKVDTPPIEDKKDIYNIEDDKSDSFFDTKESRVINHTDIIPKDTFFDTDDEKEKSESIIPTKKPNKITPPDLPLPSINIDSIEEIPKEEIVEDTKINYEPIPNIGEKLLNLRKQYLSTDKSYENFATVEALVNQISQKGYTEEEIEETLFFIKKFVDEHRYSEASQLLLVCAATESKFAQLMLARELYKGVIVNKNLAESFLIINKLAVDENAEALCDLGQFYENGIGVTKDKKKAEKLYKKSMELGIKRAETHYKRVKKANRSFFGRG